jgi:hypothetical protein
VTVDFYFGKSVSTTVSAEPHDCGQCGHPSFIFVSYNGRSYCLDCARVDEAVRIEERLFCVDCGEYLDAEPFNRDEAIVLFHGMARHQVVTRYEVVA